MNWLMLIPTIFVLIAIGVYWHIKKRLPYSISQVALYGKNGKYMVGVVLVATSVCVWLGGDFDWAHWLFCVSCLFIAVMPLTNKDNTKAHMVAAIVAGISAAVIGSACNWYPFVWVIYVMYSLLTEGKYKVLVAEACCAAGLLI